MIGALYQTQQIREIETGVVEQQWQTSRGLMELAGQAAWNVLRQEWPQAKNIIVCCGSGNNGGDGYVLARLAEQHGLNVQVYAIDERDVSSFKNQSLNADVIVDALLGIGLQNNVREPYQTFIAAINAAQRPVLSLDVPSGLNADTGEIEGIAVRATVTVTFIGLKTGLFTHQGPAVSGRVICDTLNIPQEFLQSISSQGELLNWESMKQFLPRRNKDSHKGDYGHVLVVGGDYGMGGAVRMAAEAALRVGAGLVSVATRPEHVSVVNSSRPEIMCHQIDHAQELEPLLQKSSLLVIGPGLGKSPWALELFNKVIKVPLPKVIDADGLNLLSEMPFYSDEWVLTPHPGEAARLLQCTTQEIQENRLGAVSALQKKYGGTVILKGVGTIVKSGTQVARFCPAGNPGMASGGMGDVLSGVIGGLWAQKLNKNLASEMGVLVHSVAGDLAAKDGGERGLLATDLMLYLRNLVNP